MSLAELERSPFIADVETVHGAGPAWRRIGWTVLSLIAGLVAGGVVTLLLVVIMALAFVLVQLASGTSPDQLSDMVSRFLDPKAPPTYTSTLFILAVVAIANSALFGTVSAVATLMGKQRLKTLFTAAPHFRWRLLLTGLVLFMLALGPVIALEVALTPESATYPLFALAKTLPQRLLYAVAAIVALVIAAGAEEVLCRGWLLRQTAMFSRRVWVLLLVNGLLFSALHLPDIDPNAFVGRAIMGAGFCYIVLRTGGIELAIGAHAANNILLLLFVQTLPLTPPPPTPFDPLANVSTLVGVALYVGVAELVMRFEPLRRFTGAAVTVVPKEALAF